MLPSNDSQTIPTNGIGTFRAWMAVQPAGPESLRGSAVTEDVMAPRVPDPFGALALIVHCTII